jgi:hypothetical protein
MKCYPKNMTGLSLQGFIHISTCVKSFGIATMHSRVWLLGEMHIAMISMLMYANVFVFFERYMFLGGGGVTCRRWRLAVPLH